MVLLHTIFWLDFLCYFCILSLENFICSFNSIQTDDTLMYDCFQATPFQHSVNAWPVFWTAHPQYLAFSSSTAQKRECLFCLPLPEDNMLIPVPLAVSLDMHRIYVYRFGLLKSWSSCWDRAYPNSLSISSVLQEDTCLPDQKHTSLQFHLERVKLNRKIVCCSQLFSCKQCS